MRAAQYPTATGVIELVELPDPEPGPGEVLVEVHVSGVNPTDWKGRERGGATVEGLARVIPDQDGAGVVVAVGDGVDPGRVGERVWLYLAQWQRDHGTAAELIALPSAQAVALPDGVSLELGAGLGVPAMTAHRCLFGDGPLRGEPVLVHGGAGAVGHAAIELARWGGARVATTVSSPAKAELAHAAGADLVVDYRTEDVAAAVRAWAPDGVRRIVEVDLAANLETDGAVVAGGGTVVVYAVPAEPVAVPRALMARNAAIAFMLLYTMPLQARADAAEAITAALRDGALTALPETRFPLAETAAAHDAVRDGAVGKVLIDVRS